jgi:hypothetical protein
VTSSHIFFIPGMIMIGMFLGFILGARAAKNQADIALRREADREAARAARAAKRSEAKAEEPAEPARTTEPPSDPPKANETTTAPGKSKKKQSG